ncbi:trypsin-like peptidase domain-containing protein [Streptomyces sp. HMX87]|uniref:trypsin-like peptidase domain-containing protein n=1 Tax=Streptomyces sp. HMX87 TaxID=3390849 RepID=UPI003A86CB21
MNEGKPTKAKWWSRPRPQDADGTPPEEAAEQRAQAPERGDTADGDFELARPRVAHGDAAGGAGSTGPAGDGEADRGAGDGHAEDRDAGADAGAAAAPGADGDGDYELDRPVTPGDARPRPLHEPDLYSTPPYGEPGPWAPAPPVQHPATTPAHGVAAPVHAMPASAAAPGSDTVVPAQGAAASAHGTAAPPAALGPGVAASGHGVTGPGPGAEVPGQGVAPGHGAAAPAVAAAPGAAGGPGTPFVSGGPASGQAGPVSGDRPSSPDGADPWRRYDPWAQAAAGAGTAGPFQQNGAAVPTREQRRRRARKALVVGAALLAVLSGVGGGIVGAYLERNGGVGTVELPQAGKEPAGRDPDSVAGIAAKALPSVVTLHVSGGGSGGTGTGFVLDDRGHILTNNHVVEPAGANGEISVTFHSGDTAEATLVGRDSGYDLAVVKVSGVRGLTPMPLGNSENVQVGDPVVAIGAPFDLAGTVTSGIISAKERPITAGGGKGDGSDVSYVDALQTDAPINPGNSGGPLLDSRGRVVGINSAIRSAGSGGDAGGGQAGSIGLGFAIPINQGKRVAEELINTGRATHPVIGITLDMGYSGDGARVGTKGSDGGPPVVEGGPGDKAGIEAGDVITAVDGRRVHSGEELIVKTRAHRPGDRLELTLERDGEERTVSLVLGSSHGD